MDEAKQLWRQHVRYEYLQEKLAKEISETNGVFTIKLPAECQYQHYCHLEKRITAGAAAS